MQVWRMRHLPTGLYYCPSRRIKVENEAYHKVYGYHPSVQSNLSIAGKLYDKKPALGWLGYYVYNHLLYQYDPKTPYYQAGTMKVIKSEWQIEEVKIT